LLSEQIQQGYDKTADATGVAAIRYIPDAASLIGTKGVVTGVSQAIKAAPTFASMVSKAYNNYWK
jgi:hypothetical protein